MLLCSSVLVLLVLRLPRLGKRELTLAFFVSLFDLRLLGLFGFSSSRCLGRAAAYDRGTPWTFLLPFLLSEPEFYGDLVDKYIYLQ